MRIIKHVKDVIENKTVFKKPRSPLWATVRKEHLAKFPCCAACGSENKIEVHHIKPFNLFPELELDPNNLVTLCESWKKGVNCHLLFGHLGDYRSYNEKVLDDSNAWLEKLINKPIKPEGALKTEESPENGVALTEKTQN
jgi:hypothetical protein